MKVFINEFDNDYRTVTETIEKEFSTIEEARLWCGQESWSGYRYFVDVDLTNAANPVEEVKVKVYLPEPPRENVTAEMREGGFHMDSYILGRRHAINDCIHYLKQQGYRIAHETDEDVQD